MAPVNALSASARVCTHRMVLLKTPTRCRLLVIALAVLVVVLDGQAAGGRLLKNHNAFGDNFPETCVQQDGRSRCWLEPLGLLRPARPGSGAA